MLLRHIKITCIKLNIKDKELHKKKIELMLPYKI
jgi:hypothetical protein